MSVTIALVDGQLPLRPRPKGMLPSSPKQMLSPMFTSLG
jgi:hypothetical protein